MLTQEKIDKQIICEKILLILFCTPQSFFEISTGIEINKLKSLAKKLI